MRSECTETGETERRRGASGMGSGESDERRATSFATPRVARTSMTRGARMQEANRRQQGMARGGQSQAHDVANNGHRATRSRRTTAHSPPPPHLISIDSTRACARQRPCPSGPEVRGICGHDMIIAHWHSHNTGGRVVGDIRRSCVTS